MDLEVKSVAIPSGWMKIYNFGEKTGKVSEHHGVTGYAEGLKEIKGYNDDVIDEVMRRTIDLSQIRVFRNAIGVHSRDDADKWSLHWFCLEKEGEVIFQVPSKELSRNSDMIRFFRVDDEIAVLIPTSPKQTRS